MSPTRRRVLIVEDERLLAEAMSVALGRSYDVSRAASVAAAQRCLAESQFDAVLCDVRLPDGTAQDVRAVVTDRAGPKFVLLTGGDELAARSASTGAPVVIKPFDVDELLAVLTELLAS